MAKLSNINGLFAVEDDGAIQFNGQAGTSGYVLESRGASSPPVWTDRDTGNVTGSGTLNKVVRWTATGSTVGDGPITFATNDSTFAGDITLSTGKSLYLSSLRLVHDGSNALFINQTTGDIKIQNSASDKDIIFKGLDGASSIDALTLDMSNGGSATFRDDIDVGGTALNFTKSDFSQIRFKESGAITIDYDNDQTSRNFAIKDGSGTNLMTILDDGNVGIGTPSPNQEGFGTANRALSVKAPSSGGVANLELIGLGNADNDQLGYVNFMSQAATNAAAAIIGLRHTSDESGKLTFVTAGTERMRIHANGRVSIGSDTTIASANNLTLTNASAAEIDINCTGGHSYRLESNSSDDFVITDKTVNAQRMRVDSGGSILIGAGATSGTPSGDYRSLEIGRQGNTITGAPWKSNLYLSCNATITAGSSAFTYRYASEAPARMDLEDGNVTFYNAAAGTVGNTISWDTRMIINSSGNVGIGRTAPDYKLVVSNNNAEGIEFGPGYISGCNLWQNYNRTTSTYVKETHYGSEYHFMPAGGATGNVGIGTTSPDNKLQVVAGNAQVQAWFGETSYTDSAIRIGGANGAGGRLFVQYVGDNSYIDCYGGHGSTERYRDLSLIARNLIFKTASAASPLEGMRISSAGVVGIGDTNPNLASRLVVAAPSGSSNVCDIRTGTTANSNVGAIVFRNSASAYCGQITVNGATAVTNYVSASDYRLKEDLQDFKGLEMVSKIPVYDYKIKNTDARNYGVMAHELQEVLPQAVVGEKDAEEMQGVDYSKIVPLLVKSIQELKAEIEILKNK